MDFSRAGAVERVDDAFRARVHWRDQGERRSAPGLRRPDEEAAKLVRKAGCEPDYDAHFAKGVLEEDDMCVLQGSKIEGGSVSHSHLNVTLRNAQTGKVGCECPSGVQCTCGNACICTDHGRYSLAKIQMRDPDWEQLALRGLKWQKLHWKVVLEEGAVITITNALNVKNSTAMEVGGNEIFRYMCSLEAVISFGTFRSLVEGHRIT